jgi:hypothetical protein
MSDALAGLDPALYTRLPVLDVPGGVALGIALLAALDTSLPPAVRNAAKRVRVAVIALQGQWAEQRAAEQQPTPNPRPADLRIDRGWSAIGRRLEALVDLPIPQAARAARLHQQLFPSGLSFLTLAYQKQWAESEQRLEQIDKQKLDAELGELVGDFVLAEVRAAHEDYGRALGITRAKDDAPSPTRVVDALRELRDAMAAYGLQLVAAAYAKPELASVVRKALRPIDDMRATQARRSPSKPADRAEDAPTGAPSVSPSTPVPEVVEA